MNQPTPEKKSMNPLLQKALARLVAICKGNGVNTAHIAIAEADIQTVQFSAGTFFELSATTEDKILAGRQQTGEMIADPREIDRITRDMVEKAQTNRSVEEMLSHQVLTRKDKGFMLENAMLPIQGMDRVVSWHEPCTTCNHSGHVRCDQCHGQKYARCQQCHGQTMMKCPLCLGTGHLQGQRGGQQPCNKCNGMRRVPCTVCRRTGKIPCQKCRATGQATCPTCKGQAYSTRVVTLGLRAETRADYARARVPEHMTFLIENDGPKLVAEGDISVITQSMQEPGKIGVHYEATFPFADITFRIGNKPLKAEAYGSGKFVRLTHILDSLLAPGIEALNLAAHGSGDVAKHLKEAGRYRAIALALVTAIRANAAQTTERLVQKYPEGLSPECAAKIGKYADVSVALITRKPRYQGLIIGLLLAAVLYGVYYIGPGRGMIMPLIPDARFNPIIDAFMILFGGILTTLSIQLSAQGALQKALGHLIPPAKRKSIMPRTRNAGLWGYAAGAFIYLMMIEATRHIESANTPQWYQSVLSMIGIQ